MAGRSLTALALAGALTASLGGCASAGARQATSLLAREQQAGDAYARGDYPTAVAGYRALLQSLPEDEDLQFRLANTYARMGQLQDADQAYRALLAHDPGHAKAWHNLGVVLMRQAQAAFVQSAHSPQVEPALRDSNVALADGIARLVDTGPAATAAPAPAQGPAPASAPTVGQGAP